LSSRQDKLTLWLHTTFCRGMQAGVALILALLCLAISVNAQVCATPGKDGPPGTLAGVINTYYPGTGNVSAGATSIPIGASTGAATAITDGDLLLVIQMQDAAINFTNSDSYGDGFGGAPASGSTGLNGSGRYEYVVATGPAGATVSIRGAGAGNGLLNSYTNANATATQGQRRYQVVRVPQYSSATLGSGLTAAPWNGSTGGVLALDVAGNLDLGGATVSVDGMGFRGGGTRQLTGGPGGANTDYLNLATNAFHGGKGEGIAGTPRYIYDAVLNTVTNTGVEGYPNGSTARGAPGNAGGGGTEGNPAANDQNSGGGGGGNGGAGGFGGNTWNSNLATGGHGGAPFTGAGNLMVLGGGGGGGSRNNSAGTASSGGAGGGIVMVRAGTVSGSGTISANGANGNAADNDGGGGGGAGGSVLIVANSGGLGSLTINAVGGRGADAWLTQAPAGTPGARHGPGGGGAGGFIAISAAASTNVNGGANGVTTTASDSYGATPGGVGSVIAIVLSDVPGANAGAQCLPIITTTKTTSTPTVINSPAGTTATYAIVVSNAANRGTAINLAISDTLPGSFTYSSTVSVTLAGGATRPSTINPAAGAAAPSWSSFSIPGGGSVTLTFIAQIASTVGAGTYQNPAAATYADPTRTAAAGTVIASYDPASSSGEDVAVTVRDLTITKSHSGNFTQGQVGATYSITVTNSGSSASTGLVTVTDTIPASLTATAISGTGWTCVLLTRTCTRLDSLAAGLSYPPITLTVTVASNAPASVTNTATVAGGGEINIANDTATDPTTITQLPDMTITKSHTGNFQQGQVGATYTLTARNSGFGSTSGTVTVTDTLPVGLTATDISGAGWTCVLGTLTCTRSDVLPVSTNYPAITVTVNVANNAAVTVTNSASVSGGGQNNTANDTDTDATTVTQMPDLTVNKSHAGNFSQGQVGAQYSIVVTNSGFATTSGTVTVTDTLPVGLTATNINGGGSWNCVLATLTCTRNTTRGPGASFPAITVTVTVDANAPASVTNSVTVSGGGQTNTSNDTDTDPTTIVQPDLTIAKTHVGNFSQGQVGATYTITVINSGTASTNGAVTVTDTLPVGLAATAINGGATWTCVLGTLTCTRNTVLAAGSSYPAITLTVTVANSAPASVINSVSVSGGGETNTANDTATDPTTINHPDLTITKSHSGNFTQGQVGATYTVTATNSGAVSTNGSTVTVTDTLPVGLNATGISGAAPWVCVLGTLTCTRSDVLAAGASYSPITVTVTVANNAAASVTNSANVAGGGQTNTANDTATDPTTINQLPDMTITKSHSGNFTQGQVGATYTLTATNSGAVATNGSTVTVTDTLPVGLNATGISGAAPWACVLGTLTCTRSDVLAAGASYSPITVTVDVAYNAAVGVNNSVTVFGGGQIVTINDTAIDPTTINQLPDLTMTKSHSGNFTQGQVGATYSIIATNSGAAITSGTVTVTDTLPVGLTATAISGTGWTCVLGTLTCTRNDGLAGGVAYPAITLTVDVANDAAASVTNSVTVSGGGQSNPAGDTATDPTTVNQLPDLTIAKSHSGNFAQGQVSATYTLTATNSGGAATNGSTVTVTDTLPTGLTATAISGPGWTCVLGTLTCTRSDVVAAGAGYPAITLTVDVAINAAANVTNSVAVSGGGQTNVANDSATDPTTITQLPDMSLTKSHSGNFVQGQVGATYSITATNSGSTITSGVVTVTDTLPTGLTATALSGTGWTCVLGTLTCTRNDGLAGGASYPVITLTVDVANNAAASVTNSATVSGGGQTNTADDTATDPTTITPFTAGLVITPDAGTRPSVVQGQTTAVFNFRVTNTGNSTDQVRFLANGASAQVTGPAIITDIVIDTDGSQTVNASDTDIKNNATDVLSAPLAPNGFINVLVRILVNITAAQGDAITVTLGDAETGSPTFDDQAADSSAHEVCTVATPSTNGLREARGDRTALVDNDAQIFLEMTAPSGPVPLGSDITYTLQVSNPGLRDLTGETLVNAPAGSNSGVFIIAPMPLFGTVLKSGQTFPAGTLYTTSALSIDPLTAVWTTTPPADLTTLKRIAFNVGAVLVPGVTSSSINVIVTITTNDATNPIQEIADAFGRNSLGAGLTDQSGDISRIAGDGNANFNEGPLRGTIDGDGVIQLTTLQSVSGVLIGPLGHPGAVGPTNNDDDYTNRSVTVGIATAAPGGTTTASSMVTFTNTVQNTGNASDTFTLTAPTVPFGFTVKISTDGGLTYTTVSGGGSTTVTLSFGSQSNILVQITAPSGQTVLTGYATTIRATSGNTSSVHNETRDRLYTGYLRLNKSLVVSNGTGVGGATEAVAGAEIDYTITYTNISSSGGTDNATLIATDFVTEDPIPANTDFKVGSMTSSPGTTGLVATYQYSNDGGTTWTYTPASGAGGAPAGYDRLVTNIQWSFTGNLSQTAPNNTGSIGFTVLIR
jgi:uncharacterized repeat protein (TIGR01451 family)